VSEFSARFYDGLQARARDARLIFDDASRSVTLLADGLLPRVVAWKDLRIEPPLGRTDRRVWLDALSRVEVPDSAEFRKIEPLVSPGGGMRLVSALEAHRGAILASVVALVLIVILTVKVGVPAAAKSVAFKLPQETLQAAGDQTLRTLDNTLFQPSHLSAKRQRKIREKFAKLTRRVTGLPSYRIEFRSHAGSPNAFALPSGVIILTDEMVDFAKSDDELFAVLGHELGHVAYRHGMRLVLQQTGVALLASFFLGDVSSSLHAFGALPTMLLQNGYSRAFEQEADDYGIIFCLRAGLGSKPMITLFTRLRKTHPNELPVWFSSHPDLEERVRHARELTGKETAVPSPAEGTAGVRSF